MVRLRDTDSSTSTSTAALSTSTIARNSTLLGRVGSEPRRASGEGLFGLTSSNPTPCLEGCFARVKQGRRLAHKAANRSRDQPSPPVRSPHPRPSRGGWCPACRLTDSEHRCAEYDLRCAEYDLRCAEYDLRRAEHEHRRAEYDLRCAEYAANRRRTA
jgi:hypothetical protein